MRENDLAPDLSESLDRGDAVQADRALGADFDGRREHFPSLHGHRGHTFASFGGALLFDGGVERAGLANRSAHDRIFLYAAIFTGTDEND